VAFIDTNSNTALDSGETVISVSAALDGNNTLRSAVFSTFISFRHDGGSADISGAGQAGSFALCDSRGFGNDARAIVITVTGRIKVLEGNATGSGITNCGT
jgi:Tfp pilus assembly protein FimT